MSSSWDLEQVNKSCSDVLAGNGLKTVIFRPFDRYKKSKSALIKAGRYEEALVAADEESLRHHSHRRLGNKVLALLAMKRFAEAASLSKHLIELDRKAANDGDYLHLGIALWNQGYYDEAVSAWKESYVAAYTDAAGGVHVPLLLLYASIRLGRQDLRVEATERICHIMDSSTPSDAIGHSLQPPIMNWPGPLALFMCGRMAQTELRSFVTRVGLPDALRCRYNCQATFFIGVDRLARGDTAGFCLAMKEACSERGPAMIEAEFYLAQAESENCASRSHKFAE
jgi:tetratricopeptide (TPR) repeat protein